MLPPPPLPHLRSQDEQHLKLLSMFHYVVAGLCVLGLCFLVLHFLFLRMMMTHPQMWEGSQNGPPGELLTVFYVFYAIGGVFILAGGVMNFLSARYLAQRRYRMFSLVVSGVNCLQIPIGTVLGVFTILVLSRDSVQKMYADRVEKPPQCND